MNSGEILLIGEVVVDYTVTAKQDESKLRLGGVFHAARALWALDQPFHIACFAPQYLEAAISRFESEHEGCSVSIIGSIGGSPNLMIIGEPTEAGDQAYEHILRDEISYDINEEKISSVCSSEFKKILILSGNFDTADIIHRFQSTENSVYIDVGNGPTTLDDLKVSSDKLAGIFVSTSSKIFPGLETNLKEGIDEICADLVDWLVLKENRGGVRLFSDKNTVVAAGAQSGEIIHSVGVGDVFAAAFIALEDRFSNEEALVYCSWFAFEYAKTTFPVDFKEACKRTLKIPAKTITSLHSVRLPWEVRKETNIYIAAPDFDYMETSDVDALEESLRYHNFSPRRPIKENGQANPDMNEEKRQTLFRNDLELIQKCNILVAVNRFDDPGTLIEIGLAFAWGIPVLLYDPDERASNIMLTEAPRLVSKSLDRIISEVFLLSSEDTSINE